MRSVEPSSSVTVPSPDQTPPMPANGPDCAWLAHPDTAQTNSVRTAKIARLATTPRVFVAWWRALLPRRFPAAAAWDACRCAIPLPRSGVAAELAIGVCTTDRNLDYAFAANATGDFGARGGNLCVANGKCRVRLWFATAALCDHGHIPQSIIGRLSERRSCESDDGSNKANTDAI